jgi:hypothetical protein
MNLSRHEHHAASASRNAGRSGVELARVTCPCGTSRHIEPEALARIAGRSVKLAKLTQRARASRGARERATPTEKGSPILFLVGSICCQSAPRSRTRSPAITNTNKSGIRRPFPSRKSVSCITVWKSGDASRFGCAAAGRRSQRRSRLRGRGHAGAECRRPSKPRPPPVPAEIVRRSRGAA